jgi:uncharacterized membrane protein
MQFPLNLTAMTLVAQRLAGWWLLNLNIYLHFSKTCVPESHLNEDLTFHGIKRIEIKKKTWLGKCTVWWLHSHSFLCDFIFFSIIFLLLLVGWDTVHLVLRPLLAYCTSPRWQMRVIVEQLVEWRLAGETEVLGETLPQRYFVHHKSHMTRPGFEPGPPRWETSD